MGSRQDEIESGDSLCKRKFGLEEHCDKAFLTELEPTR